jgi:hypothetical protein
MSVELGELCLAHRHRLAGTISLLVDALICNGREIGFFGSPIFAHAGGFASLPALRSSSMTAPSRSCYRFLEFFAVNIRNPYTRRAYARAAMEFFDWLARRA